MAATDEPYVLHATDTDLRVAVRNALARAGCTWAELEDQARRRDFTTTRARLAWVAIGDLGHLAESETQHAWDAV
jgi:hypothetical protein